MQINEFAEIVTEGEGKKKAISIAQVKEVLRVANVELNGALYAMIRKEQPRSGYGAKAK